ncbi:hemoglobin [Allocatelliglobosispora scoriae]|uniref:Group 1 truncated hemoglobin n=1 Tax=Allocatelliglobosispora scoriae TaxID=643052 RepID=A0A841BMJ0_9ACTN|nr:group 1 truncated hemoglobin [Allocatelliglobosispora scoriae]MBB5869484.1 hemoglobin [Allocatelliglobosispora scoriae]
MSVDVTPPMFEEIGGSEAVEEAVRRFYERLLADPQTAEFFDGIDIEVLRQHQVALLTTVLGGPDAYSGRELSQAHAHLSITSDDYARVGAHLIAVLVELGVPEHVITHVNETLTAVAPDIITA